MIKISILIPVYNGLSFTKKCLEGLFSQINLLDDKSVKFYVVVIDDGSKDGTEKWIKENYSQVIVLVGDGNLWWSGAINKGAIYSLNELKADYLLLWNNDIYTDKEYFSILTGLVKDNKPEVIGSKIYYGPEFVKIWSAGGFFNPYNGKKSLYGCQMNDGEKFQSVMEVDWLPGMGTLIHRSVIEKIGYWDNERFPQYHGDSDFTIRAKANGFKVIMNPNLKIWNDKTNSGLWHKGRFDLFIKSLFNIRSNHNIKKEVQFYIKHSKSRIAYLMLFKRYFIYSGSYIKWQLMRIFQLKRHNFNN